MTRQMRAAGVRPTPRTATAKAERKQPTKELCQLQRFAAGASMNRFEAERVGDHCLPSTIAALQRKFGICFDRKRERVPNRFGGKTSVCRYWLSEQDRAKARRALGGSQ